MPTAGARNTGRRIAYGFAMRSRPLFAPFCIQRKNQLIAKSDQWFNDVGYLYKGERFSASIYLGGFVVECLLKAALWPRRFEEAIRRLLYASHDLTDLLEANPTLAQSLRNDNTGNYELFVRLSNWNVRVRYNPTRIGKQDADKFMRQLTEIRRWLRGKV